MRLMTFNIRGGAPGGVETNSVGLTFIFTKGMRINYANVEELDEDTSDHDSLVASTQVP